MVIADLLGVAKVAAITLNERGRISHWDDTATELFGVAPPRALGRPPAALLRLPREHRGAFEPGGFGHVWCGACTLPRVDDGEPAEVGWWVYPIGGTPGERGVSVLALAADLRRLRRDGIGITIGDLLLAPPDRPAGDAAPARRPAAARLLRVEPALTEPSGDGADTFAA
ncbi:PAS domain-containing protein, partial [Actinomadura latina]